MKLRDINDNQPQFEKANIEATVPENARIGSSLQTFTATDPDQGGKSKVFYSIDRSSDRKRQFSINENGTVSIQRSLDREETPRHQVDCSSELVINDETDTKAKPNPNHRQRLENRFYKTPQQNSYKIFIKLLTNRLRRFLQLQVTWLAHLFIKWYYNWLPFLLERVSKLVQAERNEYDLCTLSEQSTVNLEGSEGLCLETIAD